MHHFAIRAVLLEQEERYCYLGTVSRVTAAVSQTCCIHVTITEANNSGRCGLPFCVLNTSARPIPILQARPREPSSATRTLFAKWAPCALAQPRANASLMEFVPAWQLCDVGTNANVVKADGAHAWLCGQRERLAHLVGGQSLE